MAIIIANGTEGVLSTLVANGTGTVSTRVAKGSERVNYSNIHFNKSDGLPGHRAMSAKQLKEVHTSKTVTETCVNLFSLKARTAFNVSLLNASWTQLATESTCRTTALRSSPTLQTIPVKMP